DGRLDLVTANSGSNSVGVLKGNGAGGFSPAPVVAAGGTPLAVAAADVNGDGRPDLVTANSAGNSASVLLGDGAGGFSPSPAAVVATGGTGPRAAAVADMNGDGKPDIVAVNEGSNTLSVLLGNG